MRLLLIFLVATSFQLKGESRVLWPPLKDISFVSGRVATEQDINSGAAVFLLESECENVGEPLDMKLPQYATHHDEETGKRTNVIIIQAEKAGRFEYFGALVFEEGEYLIGYADEFDLLGTDVSK